MFVEIACTYSNLLSGYEACPDKYIISCYLLAYNHIRERHLESRLSNKMWYLAGYLVYKRWVVVTKNKDLQLTLVELHI